MPEELLEKFDEIVDMQGYVGRSEAIRDAMRMYISKKEWESEQKGKAATLTVVYTHKPKLMSDLIRAQHAAKADVISSTHVHLSHSYCLEVMTMKGKRKEIEDLAGRIAGLSGVAYSRLFAFSIPDDDGHGHKH